jgi:hypothetical protein
MAGMLKSYGIRDVELSLSVLVVSSGTFCEKLSDALYSCSKKQSKYKLLIHMCRRVHDIITAYSKLHVDFIVFEIDTRYRGCLQDVENDIMMLSHGFILGRMCFVHDNGVKPLEMAVNYNNIWDLRSKYGGEVLAGSVVNEAKCLYLAERILKLVSTVSGIYSGLPYIGCPGVND